MVDSRPRGQGFQPHRYHCVVSLSKNINPSLVLVQPWKTCPFINEILLMGGKESNQTNKKKYYYCYIFQKCPMIGLIKVHVFYSILFYSAVSFLF